MKKFFLLTTDVETTSLVNHRLSDKTGHLVATKAIPVTLEAYQKLNIKSTFFITGYFAMKFPEAVKTIHDAGHEIACHGYSHRHEEAFDCMSLDEQIEHLRKAKQILEDIIHENVVSFRAPALRTNEYTVQALLKTGFLIDSSIASKRFDFFLSLGTSNKIHWLTAPTNSYTTSKDQLYKKGNSGIFEIPVSAFIIPYIGTTMRVFPHLSNLIRPIIAKRGHANFLIHPIELIIEERDSNKISRRSGNLIKYLLSDVIRHKLKIKNIGEPSIDLLKKQIEYFRNKHYYFTTCKDYMEMHFNGKIT